MEDPTSTGEVIVNVDEEEEMEVIREDELGSGARTPTPKRARESDGRDGVFTPPKCAMVPQQQPTDMDLRLANFAMVHGAERHGLRNASTG